MRNYEETQSARSRILRIPTILLLATSLLVSVACGSDVDKEGSTCGAADDISTNGRTYCVASQAIIEKGFMCPVNMFDIPFGDVTLCSPEQTIPGPDQGPVYDHMQQNGGTGDPMGACNTPDPTLPVCAADSDCTAGETCVSDPRACLPSSCSCDPTSGVWGCTRDCRPGAACMASGCASDADCASGEVCNSGTCDVASRACSADSDCARGEVCLRATCFQGNPSNPISCASDADCAVGEACDAMTATCFIPPATCQSDADCAANESCLRATCILNTPASCSSDADCVVGQVCDPAQGCIADPNACQADSDCAVGEVCFNATCALSCQTTPDCPVNTQCVRNICL